MTAVDDARAALNAAADQLVQASYQVGQTDQAAADQQTIADLKARIKKLKARIAKLEGGTDPTPLPTPAPLRFGVYRSGNNKDLDTWASGWNLTAQTFYFSHWQRGTSVVEEALSKGRDVYIAWDTKDEGGKTFTAFADVVAGKIDADITYWRGALAALKAKYPDRQIHVAIAHEAEIPKRHPSDNAAMFVQMTHRFSTMMRDQSSGLKLLYWAASGTTKAFYGDAADFDLVTADRYKKGDHPVAETMTGTFQPFVNTLNAVGGGWEKLPRGITETGIVIPKFTAAQQTAWWQTMSDAIAAHDLRLVVAFMSDRDLQYVPTDQGVKDAMKREFASLG